MGSDAAQNPSICLSWWHRQPRGNAARGRRRRQDPETKRVLCGRRLGLQQQRQPLCCGLWSLQGQRLRGNQLRTVPGPPEALQGDELAGFEGQGARAPPSSRHLTPPGTCPHVHPAQLSHLSLCHTHTSERSLYVVTTMGDHLLRPRVAWEADVTRQPDAGASQGSEPGAVPFLLEALGAEYDSSHRCPAPGRVLPFTYSGDGQRVTEWHLLHTASRALHGPTTTRPHVAPTCSHPSPVNREATWKVKFSTRAS